MTGQPSNPFATRWTRPGQLCFVFEGEGSASGLLRQLEQQHYRGQIVGPHGSGKSTLLHELQRRCADAGRHVRIIRVTGPPWRASWSVMRGRAKASVRGTPQLLLVDGFEQLPVVVRWWLRSVTRLRQMGLVVTAHRNMGLPVLYRTRVTAQVATTVINQLTQHVSRQSRPTDVSRRLVRHRGNLREVLFELYDEFSQWPPPRWS